MAGLQSSISEMIDTTESLYRRGATDGLPVVPPTEERVRAMLRGTSRDGDEALGEMGNRNGILTVEKLAINGVMAGCSPVHMPLLLAGAAALADPEANAIQVSTSTGSWAYLWLVNGPVRDELAVEHRFASEARTNRRLGRALGLAYKNTALVHPGEKDMGVQGAPFKYGLLAGENEAENPWEPLHVTAGYDREESTITIGGPNSFAQYSNPYDDTAEGVLRAMVYNTPPWMERVHSGASTVWAVHCLSPGDAETLHDAGLSKRDVKEYLVANSDLAGYEAYSGVNSEADEDGVEQLRPRHDPDPDQIRIPVVGTGRGENVVIGPSLPGTVTKRVEFPDGWEELLDDYAGRRHHATASLEYDELADADLT